MLNAKEKPISNPYDTVEDAMEVICKFEDVIGYSFDKTIVEKELIYRLDIHSRAEGLTRIDIAVLTAHEASMEDLVLLIMRGLGWRKSE